MLTSLQLTNFRGFREFAAELGPVTALLGPNSSGKTTVLHAVRFACDALRLAMASDQPARTRDGRVVVAEGLLVDSTRLLPLAEWQALFVDQEVGEGVELSVSLLFERSDPIQQIDVVLACARNDQLKLTVQVSATDAMDEVAGLASKSQNINKRLRAYLEQHAPVAVFVPPFYGTVREEEYRARAVIDRLLGSGDQSHVVRNLVVDLDAAQLERLNAFLADTVGATLTRRTPADQLQNVTHLSVYFRDDNGEIELSAAGAGLVNLIALYTALSRWRTESAQRRVLFLLDEPEAHLHPRLSADMTERLGRLVTQEFGAQLLLATHSVDILNRLSIGGAPLIRCDRRAQPSAVTLASDAALFDDLATWVDLTPYTAINFLASRRVVFCEGDDEVALLPLLAELRFRNDPKRAAAFRRWSLVRLHGASNAPVTSLLRRLVQSDAIRARAGQGIFRVEVILDRDHTRDPGTVTDSDPAHVEETLTVWSRHSLESILLEPVALTAWVRAFAGPQAPKDLSAIVERALAAADADEALNTAAIHQLAAALAMGELEKDGKRLGGEQKLVHAQRRATELVKGAAEVWQRGKDRGRFVLGAIRQGLPMKVKSQLPTDVIRLIQKTDANRIGDPSAAIPAEVGDLLDRLAKP